MEKRLKKQRNRLFLRISLILLAVFITVSATYFAIRIYIEKSSVQNRDHTEILRTQQQAITRTTGANHTDYITFNTTNILLFKDSYDNTTESQMTVTEKSSGRLLADTAYNTAVLFGFKIDEKTHAEDIGYINYKTLRGALSDEQFNKISELLNKKCDDGMSYELVCTKFHMHYDEYVPLEIAVVLTDNDKTYDEDAITCTFNTGSNMIQGLMVTQCNEITWNIIPKDFILNAAYNKDFISGLTEEEKSKETYTVSTAPLEYVFYFSNEMYLSARTIIDDTNSGIDYGNYQEHENLYLVQYAKKVNLFESCKGDIFLGTAIIFVFFLTIAVILCLMIWKMVKMNILQEKKRADMTNALAHDIKTPLFVISGYAYSLKENIDENERDIYLDRIIEQTEQVNSLVHKMLDLSKLDSYKTVLNRSEFDLSAMMDSIVKKYGNLPETKSMKLTHSGNNTINADKELLQTAIQNLTDNAVRYSLPNSEIIINVNNKTLTISNKSEPLTKSEIKQIWQPYVRKDKSRHQNGNGLGLSIVKSILDLHKIRYNMSMKDQTLTFRAEFN